MKLLPKDVAGANIWVHIRSSVFGEAMYIDGKLEYSDDILLGVPEAFDVLVEKIGDKCCCIDFTHEDIPDDKAYVSDCESLFPERITREEIDKGGKE